MPYKVLVFSINSGSAGMREHLKGEMQRAVSAEPYQIHLQKGY